MVKRSPRYPRQNLPISLEQIRKLFAGAHQSKVDVDTAAKVIGYAGSGGGAASSALGALRQYGLVEGLRGDVSVSDLAMRILQPMNDTERVEAIREAATKPEIFSRVIEQFGGRLPSVDEPIRAFLIRQEGFSSAGANELIKALRETLNSVPDQVPQASPSAATEDAQFVGDADGPESQGETSQPEGSVSSLTTRAGSELITLPLGQGSKAELRFYGAVTSATYSRLIRHLELLREVFDEDSD